MTEQPTDIKPRRKRRRLIIASLLAVGLLLAAFIVWPYFIPTAWIEKAAQAVIAQGLDRPVSIGSVRVTRLGHIRMDEVVIWRDADKSGPLARWQSFDLSVSLLPLIGGKVNVERVSIVRPELFVPLTEEGRPSLELPFAAGGGALGLLVGRASIMDGAVTVLNTDSTPRFTIRNLNFTGRLQSIRGPLTFRVSFSAPDATERAGVEMEGELSLIEGASELSWEALRGRATLRIREFDWEEAMTPKELQRAVEGLPGGFVRGADGVISLIREGSEAVEVSGSLAVEQLHLKSQRGKPLELADSSLAVEGSYDVPSGVADMKLIRFASPWLEAEFTGRLRGLREGMALEGLSRGRLTMEGLPLSGREALASQGVVVTGPIAWEARLAADSARTAVSGTMELGEAGINVAGLALWQPGEPGRVNFDIEQAGEPWTIHRLELQKPEGSVEMVGKVLWRPPDRTSVDLRITSRALAEHLLERWYELHPDSPRRVAAVGPITADATVRGLVGGLTMEGRLDATEAMVSTAGLGLKSPGEPASLKASLELKKNTLLVRQADASLPMGSVQVRGKLPMDASQPRYDLRANVSLNLDEFQKRLDSEVIWLPAGVTVAGSAEAKAKVNRFQQTLGLEAELDATALEVHWGLDGHKASGVPARMKLVGTMDRGVGIDDLTLQVGPAAVSLSGQVAEGWKSASLRYLGSVMDLSALSPLWQPLETKALAGGVATRGSIDWSPERSALNGSVDFRQASLTLAGEPAVRLGLNGTVTHSQTSFSTEKLLISVDDKPVTLTAAVEREGKSFKVLSQVEAAQVDLSNLLTHLEGPDEGESTPWGALVAAAIKEGSRLHAQVRAEALKLKDYTLNRLDMEATAADGVLNVPRFAFGLNGGEATHTFAVDFTGPKAAVQATIDWTNLGADPNLRPFLDHVFPNLFVTGSMGFSARYKTELAEGASWAEALEGTSTMEVLGGYIESARTPEETRSVFPTLSLSHYVFDWGRIESKTEGGRSHNVMTFEAPTVNLYMSGWTDNRTREIDYVVTVDLVENLGLGGGRDKIPSNLQSASRVEVAYIKGTIDNQRVEYLAPKVAKIKNTLSSLLGLKAIQHLLVGMSEEEKAGYREGKVGGLFGNAAKPFRYLKRKLKTQ